MTPTQLIFIAVLAVLVFWAVGAYNRLVRLKNTIANAFGPIDVQLKRRYDLVSNLVEATKKHLGHERETLEVVINARNQAKSASDAARSRPSNALAVATLAAAEQALSGALSQLFALNEASPELKADPTVSDLNEELTSTKNKVSFACQAFNAAVLDYNHAQGQFPALLVARLFSFAPAAVLLATDSADQRKTE